jgi:hypothetical protein
MPPPITRWSTLVTRLPRRSSLVETLAPPTTAITGRSGCQARLQRLQLGLHQPPRRLGQQPRQAPRSRHAPGAPPKRHRSHRLSPGAAICAGQRGVVLFLAGMEAGVSSRTTSPGFAALRSPPPPPPTQSAPKTTLRPRGLPRGDDMGKAHLRHHLALGPVEMRQQHRLAARAMMSSTSADLVDPRHVGDAAPSIGTLMSTRVSTTFPAIAMSSSVFQPMSVSLLHARICFGGDPPSVNRSHPFALPLAKPLLPPDPINPEGDERWPRSRTRKHHHPDAEGRRSGDRTSCRRGAETCRAHEAACPRQGL